jgi:hypothetical protein
MNRILIDRKVFFTMSAIITLLIIYFAMQHIVRSAYESYWAAINRVQTVDFNILASTSIGTVSEILRSGNTSKAQEFVASNYCLFRIQIEKCADAECRARSLYADNAINDSARCRALAGEKEHLLAVPVFQDSASAATVNFDNAYSATPLELSWPDRPIGYLNLFRGNPVPFDVDFKIFLSSWLKGKANASRHAIYKTAAWASILIGLLTFMLLFVILPLSSQEKGHHGQADSRY